MALGAEPFGGLVGGAGRGLGGAAHCCGSLRAARAAARLRRAYRSWTANRPLTTAARVIVMSVAVRASPSAVMVSGLPAGVRGSGSGGSRGGGTSRGSARGRWRGCGRAGLRGRGGAGRGGLGSRVGRRIGGRVGVGRGRRGRGRGGRGCGGRGGGVGGVPTCRGVRRR